MCAMALRLGLVFRPVSPSSGHSLAARRRGGPALLAGLGPVRHASLELEIKKYSPYRLITLRALWWKIVDFRRPELFTI